MGDTVAAGSRLFLQKTCDNTEAASKTRKIVGVGIRQRCNGQSNPVKKAGAQELW